MLKCIITIFLALLLPFSLAFAEISKDNFTLAGYLKNETSVRIESLNNDLSKFKNIVELSGEYKIKDDLVFFAKVKYWYDAAYDFRDKLDQNQHYMGHIQRMDWLRDCYLDYIHGPWFLRLGKQQVAWGQADGITILDRVNPFDLSEYWLPDFVDLRIPLWMANINYSPKLNSNLQLLIIPDFEASAVAPPYTPFAFRSTNIFYNATLTTAFNVQHHFPGKQFDNSTFGLQWSDRVGDLNYTLNYLNGYYTTIRTLITGLNVNRSFKRWRMYGGSFNKTFTNPSPMQGITLRGDFAYYNDEPVYYGDPVASSTKGFKRWDNIFWLVGVDKSILTDWSVSFQFAQYILEDSRNKAANLPIQQQYPMNGYTYGPMDQVENIFTLKVSTDFLHERLKPECLWSFTDDNQGKLSPKLTYEIKDNLFLTLGIHYFYGNEWDSNGQYRDQNQFYTHLKYTF